ncbi:MAG: OmpA family protein [Polyangiaceae bacterium]
MRVHLVPCNQVRGASWAFGVTLALVASTAAAAEPSVALDRFTPPPAGDPLLVARPAVEGELRPAVALVTSVAYAPLRAGDVATVEVQWTQHQLLSLSLFERWLVGVDVPFTAYQSGVGWDAASDPQPHATFDDLALLNRLELWEGTGYMPSAAVAFTLFAPTGDAGAYTSTGHVRYAPSILLGADSGRFLWTLELGGLAGAGEDAPFELTARTALGGRIGPVLLSVTADSAFPIQAGIDAFSTTTTHVEVLGSASVAWRGFSFGLAGGAGLTSAVGTPDARALASFGWALPYQAKAASRGSEGASTGTPPDPSNGSNSGTPPTHPTPDPVKEPAPRAVLDHDGDGIEDSDDSCPEVAGVASLDKALSGCPRDLDRDGVADKDDACPEEAGVAAAGPDNGCPPARTVRIVGQQIVITETVRFTPGSDVLAPDSDALLGKIARILTDHPEIARVAIEGHTDDSGDLQANVQLSRKRAVAVMRRLIDLGVDERRLEAAGYGPKRPIADNTTPEGREKNRRVDFQIVRRTTEGEKGWRDGPSTQP